MRRLCRLIMPVLFTGMLAGCAPLDTRPADSAFEDEGIENQAISQIVDHYTGAGHVNVTCFNRRLLLTGEVPGNDAKREIEMIVSGVAKVKTISDELVVGEVSGITSRTTDSMITSDVKFRFIKYGSFPASNVKIMTESGTVFLMGRVNRKEGASAADLASTTDRVKKVILLFDYLD